MSEEYEIPKTCKETIYAVLRTQGYSAGTIGVQTSHPDQCSGYESLSGIILCEKEVVFDLKPMTRNEVVQSQVDGLNREKTKIMAESQHSIDLIEARIQKLLAITYVETRED